MSALLYYRVFNSAKLHFKYKHYCIAIAGLNKATFTVENYNQDNGKYFYEKFARNMSKDDFRMMCYANLFLNPDIWIADLLTDQARDNYLWCKKYNSRQQYFFMEDFSYLKKKYGKIANFDVCREVCAKKVHPETAVILCRSLTKFHDKMSREQKVDVVKGEITHRIFKYASFVSVPDISFYEKIKSEMVEMCLESA